MIKIDQQALQEDLRKVGIGLVLAGFADIFFNDSSHLSGSSYILISGAII